MFGMLDYRAHKLFWLVTLPFRLAWRVVYFVVIAAAILIAQWTQYSPLVQIIIGYVTMEGIFLVCSLLWLGLITWPVEKVFFWMVDVVPARGEDEEEAKEIVRKGPIIWLTKKLLNHIDSWTWEDTDHFVSLTNWRARLLFDEKQKVKKRVEVLEKLYYETGKQPSSLPQAELDKLLKAYKPSWFQIAIVTPHGFNSIMGASIIIVTILYLSSSHG
jgi:hypothetical protein